MNPGSSRAAGPSTFGEADLQAVVAVTLRDLHPGVPGLPIPVAESSLDRDLGLDSLARMELLRIEAAAGVALPEDTLQSAETLADLWRAVQRGAARSPGKRPQAALRWWSAATAGASPASMATGDGAEPWHSAQTLLEVLDAHVQQQPDRVRIVYLADDAEQSISYRRLAQGDRSFNRPQQSPGEA